jgi:hypothetical protein
LINASPDIKYYFCKPYYAWKKVSTEGRNGVLQRYYTRNQDKRKKGALPALSKDKRMLHDVGMALDGPEGISVDSQFNKKLAER